MKIPEIIVKNKLLSGIIGFAAVVVVYVVIKNSSSASAQTRYYLTDVGKQTIVSSITGTGQTSVTNQVDIKPKVSGQILKILVQNGEQVKSGQVIAQIDPKDALKTVRDASLNLRIAENSLAKLKQSSSGLSLIQAQNAVSSAQTSLSELQVQQQNDYKKAQDTKQNASDNINKSYEDAFSAISSAFVNIPNTMYVLNNALYGSDIGQNNPIVGGQINEAALVNSAIGVDESAKIANLRDTANASYSEAKTKYDIVAANYKNLTRDSSQTDIANMLTDTLDLSKLVIQAAKNESTFYQTWNDDRVNVNNQSISIFPQVKQYESDLGTAITQLTSSIDSMTTINQSLTTNQQDLTNAGSSLTQMDQNNPLDVASAQASLKEKQAELNDLQSGSTQLDIQAQELSVEQKQNALADAQDTLADYSVKAPFDGTMANITGKLGDTASSGTSIATIITAQKIAEISLNEVDAAKVKVGQKATLSFDAIDSLSITGDVVDIDTIGTVSQGVVTYTVKINFDTQDERIKPGMSVNAAIITDIKQDVIAVPNSAVKSSNGSSYVEMLDSKVTSAQETQGVITTNQPKQQAIEIGVSNDTYTEITSGLNEGDQVITRSISTAKTTTTTSSVPSLFGGGGGGFGGAGGNAARSLGR